MAPKTSFFLFFSALTLFRSARTQDRAPHGLVYENPVAFSPSAFEFFHPKTQGPETKSPCDASSSCSPLPLPAQLQAAQVQDGKVSATKKGGSRLGAGGIAGIVLGLAVAVLSAAGVYYVVITRRVNVNRANSVQPDA